MAYSESFTQGKQWLTTARQLLFWTTSWLLEMSSGASPGLFVHLAFFGSQLLKNQMHAILIPVCQEDEANWQKMLHSDIWKLYTTVFFVLNSRNKARPLYRWKKRVLYLPFGVSKAVKYKMEYKVEIKRLEFGSEWDPSVPTGWII